MTNHVKPLTAGEDGIVSKSQLKREAKELFKLGRELAELRPSELATLAMDSSLREAIEEVRGIRSNVAKKRQLGFVAKMLRNSDFDSLREAMASRDNAARVDTDRLHRVETWRDTLIEKGDTRLAVLIRERSDADPQSMRQLVRNAQRELAKNKPPASARKLFRVLKAMDESETLPDPEG